MLEGHPAVVEPTSTPLRRRRWIWAAGSIFTLIVVSVMAFAIFEPIQVLPRIRLGPGFALTDQHGDSLTSEDLRGSVVLYTFTYGNCPDPCPAPEGTVASVQDRIDEVDMGDTDVRFVTLTFDPARDDPSALTAMATSAGADGSEWVYAAPQPELTRTIVGTGFKTWFEERDNGSFAFDPTLVLVDGWGIVRGEYRYQTLADDADRILRHIGILGEEIRNSHGPNKFAYEAAHVFLCYP